MYVTIHVHTYLADHISCTFYIKDFYGKAIISQLNHYLYNFIFIIISVIIYEYILYNFLFKMQMSTNVSERQNTKIV